MSNIDFAPIPSEMATRLKDKWNVAHTDDNPKGLYTATHWTGGIQNKMLVATVTEENGSWNLSIRWANRFPSEIVATRKGYPTPEQAMCTAESEFAWIGR